MLLSDPSSGCSDRVAFSSGCTCARKKNILFGVCSPRQWDHTLSAVVAADLSVPCFIRKLSTFEECLASALFSRTGRHALLQGLRISTDLHFYHLSLKVEKILPSARFTLRDRSLGSIVVTGICSSTVTSGAICSRSTRIVHGVCSTIMAQSQHWLICAPKNSRLIRPAFSEWRLGAILVTGLFLFHD